MYSGVLKLGERNFVIVVILILVKDSRDERKGEVDRGRGDTII